MTQRNINKSDREDSWFRSLYPTSSDADSLFESIRQAYLSVAEDFPHTRFLDLRNPVEPVRLSNPYPFFAHLDTSTTYGTSTTASRTSSFDSASSYEEALPVKLSLASSHSSLGTSILAGLLSGMSELTLGTNGCTHLNSYFALRGAAGGMLSTACRSLLVTTPIVGDAASLAIFTAMKKSQLSTIGGHPKQLRLAVMSGVGAVTAARVAEHLCSRGGASDSTKFACSFAASFFGSFLARHLVSRFYY